MSEQLALDERPDAFVDGFKSWYDRTGSNDLYRYELGHRWAQGPILVGLLCNPSKARAGKHDHTTRKWTGFGKRLGCGAWVLGNVCGLSATDPSELLAAADPVGPENEAALRRILGRPGVGHVVLGWGEALPPSLRVLAGRVVELVRAAGHEPMCLGRTASGQPRHPLMLAYSTPLEPWTQPPLPPPDTPA